MQREYPNLKVGGDGKRTINNMNLKYQSPLQVYRIIHRDIWPYRGRSAEGRARASWYHKRDLALAALLYLTSGRINEVLLLTRDQFVPDAEDKDFMVVQSFWVSKRKEGRPHPIVDIPLPKVGRLSGFTQLVEDYIQTLAPTERLFRFGKARALHIIDCITSNPVSRDNPVKSQGLFNHWFRAQSFSYQVNLIRSTIAVAKDRGIENPSTLSKYYTGSWKEHSEDLKK